jgi:hypothetical protein
MTSANVYYLDFQEKVQIEYDPEDRTTWISPKLLHRERCHALTDNHFNWDKILSLPLDTTEIHNWGYTEDEEEWSCQDVEWDENEQEIEPEPLPTLREWLETMKVSNKELREKLKESMT